MEDDNSDLVYGHIVSNMRKLEGQNIFYRNIIAKLSLSIMFLILVAGAATYSALTTQKHYYLKGDGDHISITPLRVSSGIASSSTELANWAAKIITESVTLNFNTYKSQLSSQQKNWEIGGLRSFIASLKNEGVIDALERRKNTLATLTSPARITAGPEKIDGKTVWAIEIPLVFSFESTSGGTTGRKLTAKTIIVFDPNNAGNDSGLLVKQAIITKE